MESIKPFYILPFIAIIKVENVLTEESKKVFNSNWSTYYEIVFGWLLWDISFNIYSSKK